MLKLDSMKQVIKKIILQIEKADKIAFFHHVDPDGDSLSCSWALVKALKKQYPKKTIKWVADLKYIKKRFSYLKIDQNDIVSDIDSNWLTIIGDTSVKSRIYNYHVFEKGQVKICFDHHQNEIDFNS